MARYTPIFTTSEGKKVSSIIDASGQYEAYLELGRWFLPKGKNLYLVARKLNASRLQTMLGLDKSREKLGHYTNLHLLSSISFMETGELGLVAKIEILDDENLMQRRLGIQERRVLCRR
ncbi:MAG: hypothetical protein AABX71_00565 [Nanoarchaeota archaeon]